MEQPGSIEFDGVEESVAKVEEKLKPVTFKFVEGQGLVPLEEDESIPPNHNQRRLIDRQIRRAMTKRKATQPAKGKRPHNAKKWNHDARRSLEHKVLVGERQSQMLQAYLDSLKAELAEANKKENEAA